MAADKKGGGGMGGGRRGGAGDKLNPWKIQGYKPGQNVICKVMRPEPGGYSVLVVKDNLPGYLPSNAHHNSGEEILAQFVCIDKNRILLSERFTTGSGKPVMGGGAKINWEDHLDQLDESQYATGNQEPAYEETQEQYEPYQMNQYQQADQYQTGAQQPSPFAPPPDQYQTGAQPPQQYQTGAQPAQQFQQPSPFAPPDQSDQYQTGQQQPFTPPAPTDHYQTGQQQPITPPAPADHYQTGAQPAQQYQTGAQPQQQYQTGAQQAQQYQTGAQPPQQQWNAQPQQQWNQTGAQPPQQQQQQQYQTGAQPPQQQQQYQTGAQQAQQTGAQPPQYAGDAQQFRNGPQPPQEQYQSGQQQAQYQSGQQPQQQPPQQQQQQPPQQQFQTGGMPAQQYQTGAVPAQQYQSGPQQAQQFQPPQMQFPPQMTDEEKAFHVYASNVPARKFQLRRAIDLIMPPIAEESLTTLRIGDYDVEWLITDLEGGMRTGCVKAACESRLSRAAMLLYKGRAVGCIYGCKTDPNTRPTEESLNVMLADLESPDTIVTMYDLPEDVTLAMSSLFLGYPVERNDDYNSREYMDYICDWFAKEGGTATLAITLGNGKGTCLGYVYKGQFSGAFYVEDQTYSADREFVYGLLERDPNAQLEVSILPPEMHSSAVRFGFSLSMARSRNAAKPAGQL